jgi:F-box/WD-40 domain protein 7
MLQVNNCITVFQLALYVLSFLCPRDLLRAAQTCRYWRILCEDNLLWREKCREAELGDFKDLMRCRATQRKASNGFIYSACKSSFMRQHNIDMNWRVRPVRQVKVLKGHDDHVITCLQFSNNRLVSGSDDNTLKVIYFG